MQDLINYLNRLSEKDKQIILKISLAFNAPTSNKHRLLKMILGGQIQNDYDASNFLYKHKPNDAYYQTKKRLKQEIFKYLLLFNTDKLPEYFSKWQRCNLQIVQAQNLLASNANKEGTSLLKKAWVTAKLYEYNELLFAINETIRRFGINSLEKNQQEIINNISISQHKILNRHAQFMSSNLKSRKRSVKAIHSSRLAFWDKLSHIHEQINKGNLHRAADLSDQLEKFIFSTLAIKSNSFLWELANARYLILAFNHNHAGALKEALNMKSYAVCSQKHLLQAQENIFMSFFHANDLESAAAQLIKMNENTIENIEYQARLDYLKANLFVAEQQYRKALTLLQKCQNPLKDLLHWNGHARILEMMILFELKDLGFLICRLEAFRKYKSKFKDKEFVRITEQFKLFAWLNRDIDNWSENAVTSHPSFQFLSKNWKATGPELINFNDWIIKSVAKKQYMINNN